MREGATKASHLQFDQLQHQPKQFRNLQAVRLGLGHRSCKRTHKMKNKTEENSMLQATSLKDIDSLTVSLEISKRGSIIS